MAVEESHPIPADAPTPIGRLSAAILGPPLAALVSLACLAALACWLPHYLTWAWWPDLDAYATMALAWEAGERPYRDVVAFNFPGQVYLFWALGKLFGWGRTTPIYALDGMLLLGLGLLLGAWSRRRFGSRLPGAVAFLAFVF